MKVDRMGRPISNNLQGASLNIGDRVRMSALGRERHPRYGDRQGVIVGIASPSILRVKFDATKTTVSIHRGYLEHV
ncbi:hypothetical protein RPD_1557 [Rhodopseudomonas palustris BisB5]|uniref:Uncharacterized protein n=1 Tax=Rhodopseudomonas palustris (strain BisB5) TaxID=316057 RepID=Q13AU5_RHOPS|nr:hypothetical protein RPD_1557 [Rhodopseudomonas palustris BisB5]